MRETTFIYACVVALGSSFVGQEKDGTTETYMLSSIFVHMNTKADCQPAVLTLQKELRCRIITIIAAIKPSKWLNQSPLKHRGRASDWIKPVEPNWASPSPSDTVQGQGEGPLQGHSPLGSHTVQLRSQWCFKLTQVAESINYSHTQNPGDVFGRESSAN